MLSILQLNSPMEQTKPLLQLQKVSLSGWTGSSALVPRIFSYQVCKLSSLGCCWDQKLSWDGFKAQREKVVVLVRGGSFSLLHTGFYSLRLLICSLVKNNDSMRCLWGESYASKKSKVPVSGCGQNHKQATGKKKTFITVKKKNLCHTNSSKQMHENKVQNVISHWKTLLSKKKISIDNI